MAWIRTLLITLCATLGACTDTPYHRGLGVFVDVTSCGPSPCGYFDSIVRGGTASLRLTPVSDEQLSLAGTRLVSDAPDVIEVVAYAAQADEAGVDVATHNAGMAVLSLVDSEGNVVDELPIEVRAADHLFFGLEAPNAVVDIDEIPGFGIHFTLDARTTSVAIYPKPYAGDDPLMGNFGVAVAIDESAVPPDQRIPPIDPQMLATGRFSVSVTPGDHDLSVDALGLGVSGRFRLTGR